MKLKMFICLGIAGVLLSVSGTLTAQTATVQVREQRLGARPEDRLYERMTFLGRHVAWIIDHGSGASVVVDGQQGPKYDDVDVTHLSWGEQWLDWSRDGEHWAYWAKRGDNWHPVIDDNEGPAYNKAGHIEFGPNSQRVAYQVKTDGKWFMVVDGTQGPAYDAVSHPKFSKKGERVAYIATKGRRQCLVVDGKEEPLYDEIDYSRVAFSPDERRFAYVGRNGQIANVGWKGLGCVAIVDGKAGPAYNWIGGLEFSPDGKRVAYRAMKRDYFFHGCGQ